MSMSISIWPYIYIFLLCVLCSVCCLSLFATMTNVNFSDERFLDFLKQAQTLKGKATEIER